MTAIAIVLMGFSFLYPCLVYEKTIRKGIRCTTNLCIGESAYAVDYRYGFEVESHPMVALDIYAFVGYLPHLLMCFLEIVI